MWVIFSLNPFSLFPVDGGLRPPATISPSLYGWHRAFITHRSSFSVCHPGLWTQWGKFLPGSPPVETKITQLEHFKVQEQASQKNPDGWFPGPTAPCLPRHWKFNETCHYIGGHQANKKWLSYRERAMIGRRLKVEEAEYVTEIARRIAPFILLQFDLDTNYTSIKNNTWPWPRISE